MLQAFSVKLTAKYIAGHRAAGSTFWSAEHVKTLFLKQNARGFMTYWFYSRSDLLKNRFSTHDPHQKY